MQPRDGITEFSAWKLGGLLVSVTTLAAIKRYLRVTHTSDDTLLQDLLDSAEDEALRFMNRDELPGVAYSRRGMPARASLSKTSRGSAPRPC